MQSARASASGQPRRGAGAYAWTARALASHLDANVGRLGEQLCVEQLEKLGFRVVARRLRTPHGELDLVARLGAALWCFEVKSSRAAPERQAERFAPGRRLSRSQLARLRRAAAECARTLNVAAPRVALIEVWIDERSNLARWRVSRL